jgi:hypothetical protein
MCQKKLGQTGLFMESLEYIERSNHQRWTTMGPTPGRPHPRGWIPSQGLPLGRFGKRGGGVPTRTRTPPRFGKRGRSSRRNPNPTPSRSRGGQLAWEALAAFITGLGGGGLRNSSPQSLPCPNPSRHTLPTPVVRAPPSPAIVTVASSSSTSPLSLSRGALPVFYPISIGDTEALPDLLHHIPLRPCA